MSDIRKRFLRASFTGLIIIAICPILINACQKTAQTPAIWQPAVTGEPITLGGPFPNNGETIENASLWLTKIYGLSADTAFLLGSYQFPAVTYRTILLRTDDAGRTWQEVHPGISDSTLYGIDFVSPKIGFVYGQWTTEGMGPPFFLYSEDGGLSWERVGGVEESGTPFVYAFDFTDEQHGIIKLIFHAVGLTPEQDHRIETHETHDGGKTWAKTASKMISDDEETKIRDTMADDTLHLQDGVGWRIEEAGGDAWTYGYWIARSMDNGSSWERVTRFARYPFAPKFGVLEIE